MRTTAFALFGVTTAMALGLVALISHQSWPYLPVGPVPSYQSEHGRLDSAIALTPAAVGLGIWAGELPGRSAHAGDGPGVTASDESRLSGSRRVTSHSAAPDPALGQPGGGVPSPAPGAAPTSQPPVQLPPTPVATPVSPLPAAPPPAPTAPSPPPIAAANPGKGHAYGREKVTAAPKPKPPDPAPTPTPTPTVPAPATPPATPAAPALGSPDGPGNGHGHAYGHEK